MLAGFVLFLGLVVVRGLPLADPFVAAVLAFLLVAGLGVSVLPQLTIHDRLATEKRVRLAALDAEAEDVAGTSEDVADAGTDEQSLEEMRTWAFAPSVLLPPPFGP